MDISRYTVGWIAPLPLEATAARSALEQQYGEIHVGKYGYHGGRIGDHDVVIGVQSRIGTDAASDLAARMKAAFPNLRFFLVVGIGGGVPRYGPAGAKTEMVLGDVVISVPRGNHGGVIRYDTGAWEGEEEGRLNIVGHTNSPPDVLLSAVNRLKSNHDSVPGTKIPELLAKLRRNVHEALRSQFDDQGQDHDRLFDDHYSHPKSVFDIDCIRSCDLSRGQRRVERGVSAQREKDDPKIHYGNIGSSNQLQISTAMRNRLQEEDGAICFEMEGAGVIQRHSCLIVRGICDYSDSHKNKIWQPYAALTAAAYGREVLENMPAIGDSFSTKWKQEVREMLLDLRIEDPRHDKCTIEQRKGGLLNEAFVWILDSAEFIKWRDDSQSRLLWIKGGAGKGKTMLMCGIINELSGSSMTPYYFFCQAIDSAHDNSVAVLRGLLYMLVDQQPLLAKHFVAYKHAGKALFEGPNAWTALSTILETLLEDPSLNNACLIIDALDECRKDLEQLLRFIKKHTSRDSHVKWLISSRNEVSIERVLRLSQTGARLSLEIKKNSAQVAHAINAYIDHRLRELSYLDDNVSKRDHAKRILKEKADGTFLWVSLVMAELQEAMDFQMMDILEEVPPGLENIYQRMLDQIKGLQKRNQAPCRSVLATVLSTYRPLHLQELFALSGLSETIKDINQTVASFVKMCGSFLMIQDDHVFLVHESAKDFLSGEACVDIFPKRIDMLPKGVDNYHRIIFQRSIRVMSENLHKDMYKIGALGCPIETVSQPDPDPLERLRYPCIYWVDHLSATALDDDETKLEHNCIIHEFLRTRYVYWLEALSLCKNISAGVFALRKLESWCERPRSPSLSELVRDGYRFLMYHKLAIESAPLQVYASALMFSPESSLIKALFANDAPDWIRITTKLATTWSTCFQTLEGHRGPATSVAFSLVGTQLASASTDGTIRIWDVTSGVCVRILEKTGPSLRSPYAVFSPTNPDQVASFSPARNNLITIWDVRTGECSKKFKTRADVECLAYSPSAHLLASCEPGKIKLWDMSEDVCAQVITHSSHKISAIKFSPCGQYIALAAYNGRKWIWQLSQHEVWENLDLPSSPGPVTSIAFSLQKPWSTLPKLLASAWDRKTRIQIWDLQKRCCVKVLDAQDRISSVAFIDDRVALGLSNGMVEIWNCITYELVQTLKAHTLGVISLACTPKLLASASEDHTVRIWDTLDDTNLAKVDGHHEVRVHDINISPNAKHLAVESASIDGIIKLWDMQRGICLHTRALSIIQTLIPFKEQMAWGNFRNSVSELVRIYQGDFSAQRKLSPFIWTAQNTASGQSDTHLSSYTTDQQMLRRIEDHALEGLAIDFSAREQWITYRGDKIVRLPPEYRPAAADATDRWLAVGTASGRVWICEILKEGFEKAASRSRSP